MVWPFGPSASFNAIVTAKRTQRGQAIDSQAVVLQADGPMTAQEVAIVSKGGRPLAHFTVLRLMHPTVSGLEIVKSIKDRELTSTQVLRAFVKSAIIAHKETNCITEGKERWCTRLRDTS
jgi:hypothetical protein